MKMKNEPTKNGKKSNAQESLCSTLSRKLCCRLTKNYDEEKKDSSPLRGQEKAKTSDKIKKKKYKNKDFKIEIESVSKKLMKITYSLPKALESPYAYEKGRNNCETCNMDKETYKVAMKSVKVIELVADEVIEKERRELLDEDEQDSIKPNESDSNKASKKLSIEFVVYSQSKDIDHNLKCVLVNLQKSIGDMLLQLCYCKSCNKKNPEDEMCKLYGVSINVLEHLKFKYTNLTNSIIQLFKPPPIQTTPQEVCVACLKEEIQDCVEMLNEIIKYGRNLKVTMSNEEAGKEKCCSRDYPHVHATVQERHVVLKFELPIEIIPPDKVVGKSNEDGSYRSVPYDQPDKSGPAKTEPEEYSVKTEPEERSAKTEPEEYSVGEPARREPEETAEQEPSVSNEEPVSEPVKQEPQENAPQAKQDQSDDKSLKVESKEMALEEPEEVKNYSGLSNKTVKSLSGASIDSVTPVKVEPPESEPLTKRSSSESKGGSLVESSASDSPVQDQQADTYCGCNFDEVYDKLGNQLNKNEDVNSQPPNIGPSTLLNQDEDKNSEESVDVSDEDVPVSKGKNEEQLNQEVTKKTSIISQVSSYGGLGYTDSNDNVISKGRKQVSFFTNEEKDVFYIGASTYNVFRAGESEPYSAFHKLKENKEEVSPETGTCDSGKVRESKIHAVDSVDLMKKRISVTSQKSRTSKGFDQNQKAGSSLNKQSVSNIVTDLGAAKLLSSSQPANNCKHAAGTGNDSKCILNLPLNTSIHSLHLDQEDLNHITAAVEKLSLNEDIVLIPECYNNWEIEYTSILKGSKNKNSIASNKVQTDKPDTSKRISFKSPSQLGDTNLQTIDEKGEKKCIKVKKTGKNEKDCRISRGGSTVRSNETELRFFTVEYPNITVKIENVDHECEDKKSKSKPIYFEVKPQSSVIKVEEVKTGYPSGDWSNLSSSPIKTQSRGTKKSNENEVIKSHSKIINKKCNASHLDEIIMKEVVYLAKDDERNKHFSNVNPSISPKPPTNKGISKSISTHSCHEQKHVVKNTEASKTADYLHCDFTKKPPDYKVIDSLNQRKLTENSRENIHTLPNYYRSNGSKRCHYFSSDDDYFVCSETNCVVSKNNSLTNTEPAVVKPVISTKNDGNPVITKGVSQQSSRKNIYTPPNNKYKNDEKCFTQFDNTVKRTEKQTSSHLSRSVENCVSHNTNGIGPLKSSYRYSNIKTAVDGRKINVYNNLAGRNNVVKYTDAKSLTDNDKVTFTSLNEEAPKQIISCNISERNRFKNMNGKPKFEGHSVNKNSEPIEDFEDKLISKSKRINNCRHREKMLSEFDMMKGKVQRCSKMNSSKTNKAAMDRCDVNCNSNLVQNKPKGNIKENLKSNFETEESIDRKLNTKSLAGLNEKLFLNTTENPLHQALATNSSEIYLVNKVSVNRHNLNRRSYSILKKPVIKMVDNFNQLKGKTSHQVRSTSINSGDDFNPIQFTNSKPEVKYVRVNNPPSNHERPLTSQKDRDMMSEINANTPKLRPKTVDSNYRYFQNSEKEDYKGQINKNLPTLVSSPPRSNLQIYGSTVMFPVTEQTSGCFYEDEGTFYLFDAHGKPLTDRSGRPLRNMAGGLLLRFDADGYPICDFANNPVFDSLGRSAEHADFNPFEAPCTVSLKVLSPLGEPKALYDFEGRPLTSVSGTVLVNSAGEGLLRFGCTGSPKSDYRGKPIYDASGKQVVDNK